MVLNMPVRFQFPSNGKARVNRFGVLLIHRPPERFQFPSNGKARVNLKEKKDETFYFFSVSIPFKRESTCERVHRSSQGSRASL